MRYFQLTLALLILGPLAVCQKLAAKTIELPGEATDLVIGGGGRYLVAVHRELQKATVIDLQEQKITGFLNLSASDALIACGRGGVAVFYPAAAVYQLWTYDPPEKKVSKTIPFKGTVRAVAMGVDDSRHVFVESNFPGDDPRRARRLMNVFDLVSGRLLLPQEPRFEIGATNHYRTKSFLMVSRSGDRVTRCRPDGFGRLMIWNGAELNLLPPAAGTWKSDGWLVPGASRDRVYSSYHGVMSDSLRVLTAQQVGWCDLPSLTHRIHFRLRINRSADGREHEIEDPTAHPPQVLVGGLDGVALELPKLANVNPEEFTTNVRYQSELIPLARRFYLVPEHEVFAYLHSSFSKLELVDFSIEKELQKVGKNYLFVNSLDPPVGKPGGLFSHQVTAASNSGGIKFELQSGPKGLAVSESGLVRWKVPTSMRGKRTSVILSLSDSKGLQRLYTFTIQVTR